MNDRSSANWFQVGDSIRVIESVPKGHIELKGRVGTVIETWEKCDVDPTCCCAEFVDDAFAVRVRFNSISRPEEEEKDGGFMHYFAEREIMKIDKTQMEVI